MMLCLWRKEGLPIEAIVEWKGHVDLIHVVVVVVGGMTTVGEF